MDLNVLHILNRWGMGGTEKVAESLLRNHENVNAFGAALHSGGPRAESLESDGYDLFYPDGVDGVADTLDSLDIDIVHSHGGDTEIISQAARQAGTPLFVRTDQFGWYFQPDQGKEIDFFLYPSKTILLRTVLLNNFDIDGEWPREMASLYNPLDIDAASGGESLRDANDVPPDVPVVGKIGRPAPEKWGKLTVKAFDRAVAEIPDAHLFLVGAPEKIKKTIDGYDWAEQVVYVDPLDPDEVGDFYQTIDVLAHTSAIGESFGYVLAEAMANRVPVVVDSTPMRDNAQVELIEHGETGYIANSASAYGAAVSSLLEDETSRRQFGKAARARTRDFGVERVVSRLEGIYRRLAVRKGLITDRNDDYLTRADQRENLATYSTDYDRRLHTSFGDEDTLHRLERDAWKTVTALPLGRKPMYEFLRKGFIFGNEYVSL